MVQEGWVLSRLCLFSHMLLVTFAALYVVHSVCVKYVHNVFKNAVKTLSCAKRHG